MGARIVRRSRTITATLAVASMLATSVLVAPSAGAGVGPSNSSGTFATDSYLAAVIASTQAAPVPPAGLKVVGQTGESVSLSWGAVADAVEYRVMYSPNADMSGAKYWRFPSTSGTVKYLKPGTTYYFKIRALKSGGSSLTGYSEAVSGATGSSAAPVPPAGLKVVGQTGESVSLSWGAVADAVEYRVMYSPNADMSGAKYWRFPSTSGTVKYLKPGTMYYFKIRALKSGGSSLTGYSEAVSGATGSSAAPVPPAGLKVVGQTGESVSLSWGAVADAVEYRVMYSPNADMSGAKYWRFPSTSGTVKYLKPGTTYYFKIRALKSGGSSLTGYSEAVSGATGSSAAPVPPAGLKVVGQTGESVSLSWGAVADAVEYRVMYSPNADMSGAKYWRFPSTSGTVKYLKPGTTYYFKIRALKSGGSSLTGYSEAVSGATGSSAAPVPPAGLKVVGQTGESVSLSWGAVADAVEYRVMYSPNADMSGAKYWRFPSTSGTVKYLKPGTTYYFKIRALKSGGVLVDGLLGGRFGGDGFVGGAGSAGGFEGGGADRGVGVAVLGCGGGCGGVSGDVFPECGYEWCQVLAFSVDVGDGEVPEAGDDVLLQDPGVEVRGFVVDGLFGGCFGGDGHRKSRRAGGPRNVLSNAHSTGACLGSGTGRGTLPDCP